MHFYITGPGKSGWHPLLHHRTSYKWLASTLHYWIRYKWLPSTFTSQDQVQVAAIHFCITGPGTSGWYPLLHQRARYKWLASTFASHGQVQVASIPFCIKGSGTSGWHPLLHQRTRHKWLAYFLLHRKRGKKLIHFCFPGSSVNVRYYH
jgi:hypothetical protein